MNRRGFLRGILAAGVAPYVQTAAGVLMPVTKVLTLHDLNYEALAYGRLGSALTLEEIISQTLRTYSEGLVKNVADHNSILLKEIIS